MRLPVVEVAAARDYGIARARSLHRGDFDPCRAGLHEHLYVVQMRV